MRPEAARTLAEAWATTAAQLGIAITPERVAPAAMVLSADPAAGWRAVREELAEVAESPRAVRRTLPALFGVLTAQHPELGAALAPSLVVTAELAGGAEAAAAEPATVAEAVRLERSRWIERLHNGPVQTAVVLHLRATMEGGPEDFVDALETHIDELRWLIAEPDAHEGQGLRERLEAAVARCPWAEAELRFGLPEHVELPETLSELAIGVVSEGLANLRHAGAAHARLELSAGSEGTVRICLDDDGAGFDVDAALSDRRPGHLGLRWLRDSIVAAGGWLEVDSAPGQGTHLEIELPAGPIVSAPSTRSRGGVATLAAAVQRASA